jgi:hypothetical protein
MAQKREKLSESLVTKLKQNQTDANEAVLSIGQIEIRLIELDNEMVEMRKLRESALEKYKLSAGEINSELSRLNSSYPGGEVDLNEGVVIYNDAS